MTVSALTSAPTPIAITEPRLKNTALIKPAAPDATLSAQLQEQPSFTSTTNSRINSDDIRQNDSVRVSSSIGKAASSGQLSREEALAIYQKIASLL